MKGCPLSCWWCHNPESQSPSPEVMFHKGRCINCGECVPVCRSSTCSGCGRCAEACFLEARVLAGKTVSVEELMNQIRRDTVFYDESKGGVTFSGGEPLAQPEFLLRCLLECKREMIHTAVDTSGFCNQSVLRQISPHVDLFLYDLKLMDDERHTRYTGVSNKLILENLQMLTSVHPQVHVRIPLIPGINDDAENLMCTGEFLSRLGRVRSVTVLPYHRSGVSKYDQLSRPYGLADVKDPSPAGLERAQSVLAGYGLVVGG